MSIFVPAEKSQLRARVALAGPTGSGKTWTALEWATVFADGGTVAVIDTERDSARLYADRFHFDVARFAPPYDVHRLVSMLREAEQARYAVVVVDSLSHFWEGEGGVLDEVDAAGQRAKGNTFAGWKHGTPLQRHMVDTFLALDMHVIVTMRSKMEYVLETNDRGQQVPRKVGMAPVQRAGIEYEFQLVGDLDLEHRITITKSRCDVLADKVIQPGRAGEAARTYLGWLNDGTPPPPRADRDAVREHVERVKSAPGWVRSRMADWAADGAVTLDRMTVDELTAANELLDSLLAQDADGSADTDDTAGEELF